MPLAYFFSTLIFVGVGIFAPPASAAPSKAKAPSKTRPLATKVLTAFSTPLKSGHPILFLQSDAPHVSADERLSTRLQFPPDQRYSKWSVIFEAPLRVETVEVTTCEGTKPFSDGVELFLDYDEKRLFRDGGRRTVKFNVKATTRALTLHFLESPGLCLENLRLKTASEWLKPRILASTGSFVLADGSLGSSPRAIGEGKKRKIIGGRKSGEWSLQWENPLIVESIRIWNGSQYPGDAFNENDRVRELEIRTDGVKAEKVTLEDRRYFQDIEIKEPRAIRTLDLKSLSTYSGNTESEPMLAEIQLSAGGENWIPIVPVGSSGEENGESAQAQVVRERGYGDILDRELRADERGDVWKFRFRSDGTFFARVFVDRARVARAWSVSGIWKMNEKKSEAKPEMNPDAKPDNALPMRSLVKAFAKPGGGGQSPAVELPGLGLVLTGLKMSTPDAFDSLSCGNHCFPLNEERGPSEQREFPVLETVELQRLRRTLFVLRNRTNPEKRTIEFSDLKVRLHSLYD